MTKKTKKKDVLHKTTITNWGDRPNKDRSRAMIAERSSKNKKHLLVMPSDSGLDVQALLEKQVPQELAQWTVVEKSKAKLETFKEKDLLGNFDKIRYCPQDLHKVKVSDPLDFAWFDFNGNLTKDVIRWLKGLDVCEDVDLFFTFNLGGGRGNLLFTQLAKVIPDKFPEIFSSLVNRHSDRITEAKIDLKYLPLIITQLLLLENTYLAEQISCYFYQDTTPMVVIHLMKVKKGSKKTPLNKFINSFVTEDALVEEIMEPSASSLAVLKERVSMIKSPSKSKKYIKQKLMQEYEHLIDSALTF